MTDESGRFENGVKYKSIVRDYTDTATIVVFVKGGLFRESAKDNGIGSLTARTWLKSGKLLETVEFIGGGVNSSLANDYFEISLSVPTQALDTVLPELKKQLLSPEFQPAVFEKEKDLMLRELEAVKDDPNSLAFQQFNETTYKGHPYALNTDGSTASVAKLSVEDVENYYKNHIVAVDMILVTAGKYSTEQLAEIHAIFKAVPKGKTLNIDCKGAAIAKNERVEATDQRIQQAKLFVAYTAPDAGSKEYLYGKILSDLLGGGMSSPYFTALRKEKGYAYSVGVMYPSRLCESRMTGYIGLQEENIDDAISTMQRLNKGIADAVTEDELEKTKNHMIGQLLLEAETNARTAYYAAFFENLGLGFDHTEKYVQQIRDVKKADLKKISAIFEGPQTVFIFKPAGKIKEK